ncbi:MAG: YdcF family protein [Pirellulaceae bacterium]
MIRRVGLLTLLLVGIAWASHAFLLRQAADWLDVSDPHLPADYLVVLPGSNETRTFAGVVILREGLAKQVAIIRNPNTSAVNEGLALPTHEVTRRIFQCRGIADERITFLDGESRTTHEDIRLLQSIWDRQPEATIIVVTNRFHTRRAMWAAKSIHPNRMQQISFIGCPADGFEWTRWWTSQVGWQMIASEYLKLGYYMVFYSTTSQRLGMGLLALCIVLGIALTFRYRLRRRKRLLAEAS